jgi:hypothetical protein
VLFVVFDRGVTDHSRCAVHRKPLQIYPDYYMGLSVSAWCTGISTAMIVQTSSPSSEWGNRTRCSIQMVYSPRRWAAAAPAWA